MNFVAIDFETASSGPNVICSMGICTVTGGKVGECREILIRPDPFEFCEYNIAIHHITPEMVENEPDFAHLWSEIFPYLNDRLVIAHNAEFDVGALLNTLDHFNIEYPTFDYLCTVKLSQKAYPDLKSHKLNSLAEEMGIDFSHHRAGDDAYVCAEILIKILKDFNLNSLHDIEEKFQIGTGHIFPGCHVPCTKNRKKNKVMLTE
ncbi:MAG: 3'-5' exonuclease [Clostridia bacterium]|nr:3'-5' exonuclease [Clostridia bacterium]